MNKPVLVIIALAIGAYVYFSPAGFESIRLPQVLADAKGERIQIFEIDTLFDADRSLESLAQKGAYTIVEVYSDHCIVCKKIEAKFPLLLQERKDIVIKRVRVFSGSISFKSMAEQQQWQDRQTAMQSFYGYYGTPHIEIYDANGTVLVKDKGRKKAGLSVIKQWLGLS